MSRVIVTGAAGFIGSHLVERLLAGGHEVVGIDNFDPFYDRELKHANLAGARGHERFTLVEGDINDPLLRERVLRDHGSAFAFVHLAAKAGVRPSVAAPLAYVEANVQGAASALELARALDVRGFVFGSSSSVYGNAARVPFSEEERTLEPISPYAGTKLAAEALCGSWARLFGMRCISLRFFTVIGERQRPDLALHAFTRAIAEGRPVPVFGDGSMRRDFTYIGDIIDGVTASVGRVAGLEPGAHEIVNLGGRATTSVLELIRHIERALGQQARLEHRAAPPGDVRITFADVTRAERLLGYRPSVSVEEGVRRFVHWYQSMFLEVA